MFNSYPDVLTVEQMAEALRIGRNTAYELVRRHEIGSRRIGRHIIIPKICLIDYVNSSRYNVGM